MEFKCGARAALFLQRPFYFEGAWEKALWTMVCIYECSVWYLMPSTLVDLPGGMESVFRTVL